MTKGYGNPIWCTHKQTKELSGYVRAGEKGSLVVYADRIHRTEEGENGREIDKAIPFLKTYIVCNATIIEALKFT